MASKLGKIETLGKLLDEGGNINSRDYNGYTALHYAARRGHLETVLFLIKKRNTYIYL